EGYDDFRRTGDGYGLLLTKHGKNSVYVNLQTMQVKELPERFNSISPNGRWAYASDSKGNHYLHRMYNLIDGKKLTLDGGLNLDFMGTSDFFLTNDTTNRDGKKRIAYLNDGANYAVQSMALGFREAKSSRTGRFVLTFENGQIKLLDYKALLSQ